MRRKNQPNLAIDINRRRLRAVEVSRRSGSVQVKRVCIAPIPETIDQHDASALGGWVATTLGQHGVRARSAVVAVGREQAIVKRLTLPTTDVNELPGMVGLAMQRDLPFEAAAGAIDFRVVERHDSSTVVLVVAVQQRDAQFLREVCGAAGVKIARLSLTTLGIASAISATERGGEMRTLAIDVATGGLDYAVVEQGRVRFSRAVVLTDVEAGDATGLADALCRETRRTWMSYRIAEDAAAIEQVVMTGDREAIEQASDEVGAMLDLPVGVLNHVQGVREDGQRVDDVWPLVGLLLPMDRSRQIDLNTPRRAPDRRAQQRMRWMAAAGLLLVIGMGLWTMGNLRLRGLRTQIADAKAEAAQLQPAYLDEMRRKFRLMHLERWMRVQPDVLAHLNQIVEIAPGREAMVLDQFAARVAFDGVQYDRRRKKWSTPASITISLDGEAKDRSTADAFRDDLVDSQMYRAVSKGTDARAGKMLPAAFNYQLRSTTLVPESVEAAE